MWAVGRLTNTEHAELLLEKKYDSEFYIRILSLLMAIIINIIFIIIIRRVAQPAAALQPSCEEMERE